jgi:hypothetical protein
MPTSLYCKNKKCQYFKFLDEPVSFKFSPIHTPFEGDKCNGVCNSENYAFMGFDEHISDFRYEGSECVNNKNMIDIGCSRDDCVHNESRLCTRSEILIDILNDKWVCKCFAFRKIRGHTDWSALLQNGNAKGGHISDADAEKMNNYAKTTRSYRTHMKQASS